MTSIYTRRHMLKLMGIGAGAVGVGGFAAACGSSGSSSGASGAFSFGSWSLTEDASKPVIQKIDANYEKAQGVSIKPVLYPYDSYLNELTLQVRGGQFSGAAQLDIAWLGALSALGKLRDLSSYAQGRGYTQQALQAGQFEGKQYGLPWTIGAIGLVANKEILDKAGITQFPTTIDDFEAALTELKGVGNNTVPYAASTKVEQLKDILIWMQTFGSPLIENGKVTIGDDASVEAVTWYKKLYDKGLIAPDVDRDAARTLFAQGRAAMYDDAIVTKGIVTAQSPDKDLGSKLDPVSRPVVKAGDKPRAQFWGHVVTVVEGDGADEAAKFAQWLTSDKNVAVGYFKDLGLPPTTTAALASPTVTQDTFTTDFTKRITVTATVNPFWAYTKDAQIEQAVAEQVQAVLVGSSSAADAMKAAGAAVQDLIS